MYLTEGILNKIKEIKTFFNYKNLHLKILVKN